MVLSLHQSASFPRSAVAALLAAALLSGCSALGIRSRAPSNGFGGGSGSAIVKPRPLTPAETRESSVVYDILVGEMAGQNGNVSLAANSYLKAARLSDDPAVAERALRIALFAKQQPAALELARRWVKLAPHKPQAHEALGVLALRAGQTAESGRQFSLFVRQAPDKSVAFEAVSQLLANVTDPQTALAVMKAVVLANEKVPQAHLAYARLALQAGKQALSLAQVQRAIVLRPDWTDAEILRAQVRMDMGQAELAARELEAAVRRRPKDLDLRLAYARLLVQAGRLPAAQYQFEVLARRAPGNVDVQYSLGLLALQAHRSNAARRYFHKVLHLGERQDDARYYLGRIAEEQGRLKAAKRWYLRVGEGEYWLDAQVRVAQITAREGHVAEARRQLAALRHANPRFAVQLYQAEGEILTELHHDRQALTLYNRAIQANPGNTVLLYGRALVAESLGDLHQAEADLKAIIKKEPDNAVALNALGYTLADRTTRYAEALTYIKKAIALRPDDPAVIDSLGWVEYRLGNMTEALKALRRAYGVSGDPEIAAHLGEVLWAAGHRAQARSVWRKALKAHPHNGPLKRVIKRYKL